MYCSFHCINQSGCETNLMFCSTSINSHVLVTKARCCVFNVTSKSLQNRTTFLFVASIPLPRPTVFYAIVCGIAIGITYVDIDWGAGGGKYFNISKRAQK